MNWPTFGVEQASFVDLWTGRIGDVIDRAAAERALNGERIVARAAVVEDRPVVAERDELGVRQIDNELIVAVAELDAEELDVGDRVDARSRAVDRDRDLVRRSLLRQGYGVCIGGAANYQCIVVRGVAGVDIIVPGLTKIVSLPVPPVIVSTPRPPVIVSLPASPLSVSGVASDSACVDDIVAVAAIDP